MKIGFFSEAQHEGKVPRNHLKELISSGNCPEATHHPSFVMAVNDNSYDIGIMIMPKNRRDPLLKEKKNYYDITKEYVKRL